MKQRFTADRVPGSGMDEIFVPDSRRQAWLDVEAALSLTQAELGIIPAAAGQAVADACHIERLDGDRVDAATLRTSHPLMGLVTELADSVGEEYGGWVHWGATTQNITQTGDTLLLVRAREILDNQLRGIVAALADLAERSADMVMAGRTHGQHAVPVTFGFKMAGFIDEYARHLDRLTEIAPRLEVALLGGAAGTSASFGAHAVELQERVAERLGLQPMAVPSRVVVDHSTEVVTLLGLVATTSGRFAREIYQLMKTEYAEVEEPMPEQTVGSSTMPHKRNPQLCQDIIGLTAELRSLVPLAFEFSQGEHESDNASSELFDVQQRACLLAAETLARVTVIAQGLELHPERMRRNLELTGGLIVSESVMLRLGETIGRQEAHRVIHDAARESVLTGESFAERLAQNAVVTAALTPEELRGALAPESYVGRSAEIAREQAARGRRMSGTATEGEPGNRCR